MRAIRKTRGVHWLLDGRARSKYDPNEKTYQNLPSITDSTQLYGAFEVKCFNNLSIASILYGKAKIYFQLYSKKSNTYNKSAWTDIRLGSLLRSENDFMASMSTQYPRRRCNTGTFRVHSE